MYLLMFVIMDGFKVLFEMRICQLICNESFVCIKKLSFIFYYKYNNYNVYLNMINWFDLLIFIYFIEQFYIILWGKLVFLFDEFLVQF